MFYVQLGILAIKTTYSFIVRVELLNIKIERVKNNEIHCIICSIESIVLYLYQIKFKAYEIILFKCRTD